MTAGLNRRALVPTLVFLLPCLGLLWYLDRTAHTAWEEARADHRALLERLVAQCSRRADRTAAIQDTATRIARALTWGEDPRPLLEALPPGAVQVFLFDGNGRRRPHPGFTSGMVQASERCHALLRQAVRGQGRPLSPSESRLVESFLGHPGALSIVAARVGRLQSLEAVGVDRSIGLYPFRTRARPRRRGSFILILDHGNITPAWLITRALMRLRRLAGPRFRFAALSLEPPDAATREAARDWGPVPPLPPAAMTGFFRWDDAEWAGMLHARHFLMLAGAAPPAYLPSLAGWHPLTLGVTVGLSAWLFWAARRAFQRGIPLRLLMATTLGAVVFTGMAALLGFGAVGLEARRSTLYRERRKDGLEILSKIDADLPFFMNVLQRRFQRIADTLPRVLDSPVKRQELLGRIRGVGTVLAVDLFDASGTALFRSPSTIDGVYQTLWGEAFHRVLGRIAAIALKRARPKTVGPEPPPPSRQETLVDRLGLRFWQDRGRLFTGLIAKHPLTLFFQIIPDRQGQPTAALLIRIRHQAIERAHLRDRTRTLARTAASHGYPFRVFAVDDHGAVSSRVGRRLPPHLLADMADDMTKSRLPTSRTFRWGKRTYLLVSQPARVWRNACLYHLSPLDTLDQEAHHLRSGFVAFGALVLLLAGGILAAASRLLLDPLAPIGESLRQIAASQLKGSLELSTGDEFETIAAGIQATIQELRERRLAQTIQHHLIPSGPLAQAGTAAQGWTRSHAEIGGEIFDCQALGADRLALWIARAPGHSIPSALVLAMIKVALRLFLETPGSRPASVLADLDRHFRQRMQGYRPAPLALAFADPARQRFEAVLRGDFQVLHLSADGLLGRFTRPAHQEADALWEVNGAVQAGERWIMLSGEDGPAGDHHSAATRWWTGLAGELGRRPLAETGPFLLDRLAAFMPDPAARTRTVVVWEVPGP
ncbi:MAG: Serine phosphatase RsbU, regulator of sigma subunit [Candidatus Ozemobacter sibiricus]|jgi:HAMP domain-containing protein|uniref:Serine phosphatase RsbU, regulator of sigma subunit n=1 Tax=Candidatus Ozemobacter sibiricus TaxID=2268124 RepID=A0A367ZLE3_9BACT|nr:MAG: Serine phosphatase RsbU, regulator of sigma subunit [Candidatus Ozemobacter sibiricus]